MALPDCCSPIPDDLPQHAKDLITWMQKDTWDTSFGGRLDDSEEAQAQHIPPYSERESDLVQESATKMAEMLAQDYL